MLLRLIVLFLTIFITASAHGNDKERLVRENQVLEAELSLARKPNIYCIFNLKKKNIQIKATGALLKELPIQDVHCWGSSTPKDALFLIKKSTFIKPGREKIKPGENKEKDTFEIDSLEPDDMPARYTLVFDKGMSVSVKPKPEGFFSTIGNFLPSLKESIVRPFLTVFYAVRGKPYTAIDIELKKDDAKALYWSLSEGTGSVFYPQ
jgi:hypothetical protein